MGVPYCIINGKVRLGWLVLAEVLPSHRLTLKTRVLWIS
ncbi:rCG49937 [Rattus norvegicus]|uniref:RCG49937 n=1 Tax=Rattus norvegicus TaxID=10116 RepID=A6K4Z0_RAT|nr:rCG49937 [Rattus norvegicus]